MCQIKAKISPGLIESERVALVQTMDGIEEVVVSDQQVQNGSLLAAKIFATCERVLIELPRESTSGRWRLWVPDDLVAGD